MLREAFDYPYQEIAEILQITEVNLRQHVSRARKHIADGRRASVGAVEQRRLLKAFVAAAQRGDIAALEELFAADIVSSADGGGIVRAAHTPVEGRERVAKFITAVAPHFWKGVEVAFIEANGRSAASIVREGSAVALSTIDATTEGIVQIFWVMRPSKLIGVSRPSEASLSGTL